MFILVPDEDLVDTPANKHRWDQPEKIAEEILAAEGSLEDVSILAPDEDLVDRPVNEH